MDRRRAAGTLLALAVCISCSAAAPTANSNQTALDVYDGSSEGCYYNFQYYSEGDRIMTNEPCLNCTCHNRMLMCYLRVCPFTKPIGQDCTVEKRADQCCPIVTCPDVPVDLLTSTSTTSPAEYGNTGVGRVDKYGCEINGKYFPEGAKVQSSPKKPCEHCYCIRNMTTCVMQECTLHVEGCTPIYHKDVCCPVRYSCDHPEDEIPLLDDMTTTVRPTPGFLLTTTTLAPVTQSSQECVHDDQIFSDGALIKTEKACEHCYCMKGDIVCVVQECGTPMENEGKNCTSVAPREGQCCPDTYICEGDDQTTEAVFDRTTSNELEEVTTTPPRRVGIEGSGYRNEDETLTIEPEVEGSGEEPVIDITTKTEAPEKETEIIDDGFLITKTPHYSSTTTATNKPEVSSEPDKGLNTVPDVASQEEFTESPFTSRTPDEEERQKLTTTTPQMSEKATTTETSTILSLEESPITQSTQVVPEIENTATESSMTTVKLDLTIGTTYKPTIETSTINVGENEIEEGVNISPTAGRIPGEGDCLLNGITYNNESSVPSTSKCHSSCKCISSIIKCEPILCSSPPEYMDNCQPIYDSPEACCPTYVCDHSKETIPPQPHSQMTETESSTTTPECNGGECQVSVKQPSECSGSECQVSPKETSQPPQECTGTECNLSAETPSSTVKPSECSGDECKIAIKVPLESAGSSEKEPFTSTTLSAECSGDDCGEKFTEKESLTTARYPEPAVSLDKEQSASITTEMSYEIPLKEQLTTTQSIDTELKQPVATESSQTAEEPNKKPSEISPSECSGNECKVIDKEAPAVTESTEAAEVPNKELLTSTESNVPSELPIGECSGDDCKVVQKEPPRMSESTQTPEKEPAIVTESALPTSECHGDDCKNINEELPTSTESVGTAKYPDEKLTVATESTIPAKISPNNCIGDECKVVDKEAPASTESIEAAELPEEKPLLVTESTMPEEISPSKCSGENCKVVDKDTPAVAESSTDIPNKELSTPTKSPLPAESPISDCSGDDCEVIEKEPSRTSESSKPTQTPKEEPSVFTESALPTGECHGDDCKKNNKEQSVVTEIGGFEKEPTGFTEPAVSTEIPAVDCHGDDCKNIDKELSTVTESGTLEKETTSSTEPTVSAELPTLDCHGDNCKNIEKEPSTDTQPEASLETEPIGSTEPAISMQTLEEESPTDTELVHAEGKPASECAEDDCNKKEPSAATESSIIPEKELSSTKEPSALEEIPDRQASSATESGEDKIAPTEPSEIDKTSGNKQSPTTELSVPIGTEKIDKDSSSVTESSLHIEIPEKVLSPIPETLQTTSSSSTDEIHTTESSEITSPKPSQTTEKESLASTEYSKTVEEAEKEMSIASESSVLVDSSEKQSTSTESPVFEKIPEKEPPATESSAPAEPAEKESPVVTQPEGECNENDCKAIEKEPTESATFTTMSENKPSSPTESTEFAEPSDRLSVPSTQSSVTTEATVSECIGDNCNAIEKDSTSTTEASAISETPQKQPSSSTQGSQYIENEPAIATEPAVSASLCIDGECNVNENEPFATSESSLLTDIPEHEPNTVRESTLPSEISKTEQSASTESALADKTISGECSGYDCRVLELEPHAATESTLSTDQPKTESSLVKESTEIPAQECIGDDCKSNEKEFSAVTEFSMPEQPSTECTGKECIENKAQTLLPTDKNPEIDCKGDVCKTEEKESVPTEPSVYSEIIPKDEECNGEGCQTAVPIVPSEPSLQSATPSEIECSDDQCKTVEKDISTGSEQPLPAETSITTEPTVPSESTFASQCIGEECKNIDTLYITKEPPKDDIEAECGDDSCRRKQTFSSETTSPTTDVIVNQEVPSQTESTVVEPITEPKEVSYAEDKEITGKIEVTTEIMPQDTSSVLDTEYKEGAMVTEKNLESTIQPQSQDGLSTTTLTSEISEVSQTEKLPAEKEPERESQPEPSTDSVLREQTTESAIILKEPYKPTETSTLLPKLETETETPEKQSPVTESSLFTNAPVTSSQDGLYEKSTTLLPKEYEPITEKTTAFVIESKVTEKQELSTTPNIKQEETESSVTKEEPFTTTVASEVLHTDNKEKPDYHDTELEKTVTESTITESPSEKTTSNATTISTETATEVVPEQSSSERLAETETEGTSPSMTEIPSIATSSVITPETDLEQETTEQPEEEPTAHSIATTIASTTENEAAKPTDKPKPEYQTQAPDFIDNTTKSYELDKQTTSFDTSSEELLIQNQQETTTTESNILQTNMPEFVTKTPEIIATESQVRVTESSQHTEKTPVETSKISEIVPQTEIHMTAPTISPENKPQSTSTSTESIKQTPSDLEETSTTTEGLREGSTEKQEPEKQEEIVTSHQPDLVTEPVTILQKDISSEATTLANADKTKLKPKEPATQLPETEETTEFKVAYSETTPYQVELELHTHKTPEEASSPANFETSTVILPSEQSKEPESTSAQDVEQAEPDLMKTTLRTGSTTEYQTEKMPFELPQTTTQLAQSESKETDAPIIQTMSAYDINETDNRYDSETNEKATETPEVQQTEKQIESEQTTRTNVLEESISPVTEKASTEKVTEMPVLTTPQAEKVEEKPNETSTSKPLEMPLDETSEDDGHFPSAPGYGQEPDYVEEDQAFGPGTCRYGGKVYVSAQQIPRDDPCDFCFCFRSDIICLQQSCPPPIHGCREEPIQGFCCPRYECPVSMATTLNVTTTTTTTTTTLPPHFLPHAYKGAAQRKGCVIKGHTYKVGEVVRASSGPCLHCTCGGDGQMKCDPKVCTPEPMLRQMIAAAVSSKRRR